MLHKHTSAQPIQAHHVHIKIGLPTNAQMDLTHDIKWRERERNNNYKKWMEIWLIFKLLLTNIETANNEKRKANWNETVKTTTTIIIAAIAAAAAKHTRREDTHHVACDYLFECGITTRTRIITPTTTATTIRNYLDSLWDQFVLQHLQPLFFDFVFFVAYLCEWVSECVYVCACVL